MTDSTVPRVTRKLQLYCALAALVLYLPASWWGAPHATAANRTHAWGVDDETPLGSLGQVINIVQPSPDRNAGYPKMHSFLVTAAIAPYLGTLWLTGGIERISGEYPFGLRDPVTALRHMTWIAHALSALLAALAIAAGFEAAALAWDSRSALLGAVAAILSFPMFYYARTGNVEAALLCGIALLTAACARYVVLGATRGRALWVGVFAGAAVATKEAAAGVVLGAAAAIAIAELGKGRRLGEAARTWGWGALSALGVYALTSGAALDTRWWVRHMTELTGKLAEVEAHGNPAFSSFGSSLGGHMGLLLANVSQIASSLSAPGLVLAAIGLAISLGRERQRAWLVWPLLGYVGFLFVSLRIAELRYMLPASFILAFFAGRCVSVAWSSRNAAWKVAAAAIFVVTVSICGLRAASLTWQMLHDSRIAAGEWLAARTQTGDVIEYFGASETLPPLPAGVLSKREVEYGGMFVRYRADDARAQEIFDGLARRRPKFVIVVPDHTSAGDTEHPANLPPQLFASLVEQRLPLRLVASFRTPPLFPWLGEPRLDYPSMNPPIRVFAWSDASRE
jgi:hypothetical protein